MGIHGWHQIVFKTSNKVPRELDALLDHMISNGNFQNCPATIKQKQINCDVSNILHTLSYKHAQIFSTALVKDVAHFLKKLASDNRFVLSCCNTRWNVCPQTKCSAFKHQYDSTLSWINSYFCLQSAMKTASKPMESLTPEERKKVDIFNQESKSSEDASKM